MRRLSLFSKKFLPLALIAISAACTSATSKDPVQTLRLPSPAKIKGLDPAYANDLYSGREISYVYEGILHFHYLKRPYTLEPNLAETLPKFSADRKL